LRIGMGLTGTLNVNGGAVNIGAGNGFNMTLGSDGSGSGFGTANFAGASSVNINVDNLHLGVQTDNDGTTARGVLTLASAGTSTVRADTILMGDSPGGGNGGVTQQINLGSNNLFFVDTFQVSQDKSVAQVTIAPGGTMTLAGNVNAAADLIIGDQQVGTGGGSTGTFDMTGGTFNATIDELRIGRKPDSATGTTTGNMTVGAGTRTINTLVLGQRTNAGQAGNVNGNFTQTGGSTTINNTADIGLGGTGNMTVSGGSIAIGTGDATDQFNIGHRNQNSDATATGTADFSGASSVNINVNDLRIGYVSINDPEPGAAVGTLTLSTAGSNQVTANNVFVGESANVGNSVSHVLNLGNNNTFDVDNFVVGGRKSNGTVSIVNGGTLNLTGKTGAATTLRIADNNVSTGVNAVADMDLSGGTFNATLDQVIIARHAAGAGSAVGSLTMDAGNVTANSMTLGLSGGTNPLNTHGTFNLNGGSFAVAGNTVAGAQARGTINVSNGVFSTADLIVGQSAGSVGVVNQTGGTINVTNPTTLIVGDAGTGTQNHSGGTTNVAGNVILGNQATGNGTYNLSQGAALPPAVLNVSQNVSVGAQPTSGVGTFDHSGGTHNVAGNMTIGNSSGPAGQNSYSLSGGTLNFGDTLPVTQFSAAPGNPASTLTINSDGNFGFTGGTLMNVSNINAASAPGGVFTQDGGRFVMGVDGGLAADYDTIPPSSIRAMTTLTGDYVLNPGGTLVVDIFGYHTRGVLGGEVIGPTGPEADPITDFITSSDLLYVVGDATIDGTLEVNVANGVEPYPWAWYDVLVADSITITDETLDLDGGIVTAWRIITDPSDPSRQILQVAIPEPTTLAVWLVVGLVALVGGWRVRRRCSAK
jgi:hypothetical protein